MTAHLPNRTRRPAGTLLAIVALALVAAVAWAEDPPSFLLKWGHIGVTDGSFSFSTGIAVSSTGFVYVSDVSSNLIQKFTTDSVFVTKWGTLGTGPGQFQAPWDVTVDPAGNVYVADELNLRIQKFDADGNFITMWATSISPVSVAADPQGQFVYTANGNIVIKYTTDGTFVTSWTLGSSGGVFFRGIGFGLDGTLYIASSEADVVYRFTSTGGSLGYWGTPGGGSGDYEFRSPKDVAVDPDGNVYVVDTRTVRKFTSAGTFLTRWGDVLAGTALGELNSPEGIATDGDGNIYVMDTGNYRVQKFGEVITPVVPTTWGRIKSLYR